MKEKLKNLIKNPGISGIFLAFVFMFGFFVGQYYSNSNINAKVDTEFYKTDYKNMLKKTILSMQDKLCQAKDANNRVSFKQDTNSL